MSARQWVKELVRDIVIFVAFAAVTALLLHVRGL
jgi:hypothetical protein